MDQTNRAMRKCVSCREMTIKKKLIRVVKKPDGMVIIDRCGKQPGRGAYVCNTAPCFAKAINNRSFDRALKAKVASEIYEQLREQYDTVFAHNETLGVRDRHE